MTLYRHLRTTTAAALLGLTLLVGAGAPPAFAQDATPAILPAPDGRGPALWVVRDADSTLYLFGTMHLLRPDTAWGSTRLDSAFESASRLILELDSGRSGDTPYCRISGRRPA